MNNTPQHPSALHLDPQSLVFEVGGGSEGTGPRVEVKQGGSCQGEQGEDGRRRERREQHLEQEVHGAESAGTDFGQIFMH